MKKILEKLVSLDIFSSAEVENFTEEDIVRVIHGMNQAVEVLSKNHEIMQAEANTKTKQPISKTIPDLVQSQHAAIREIQSIYPNLPYAQCFEKAKRDNPNIFQTETITISGDN